MSPRAMRILFAVLAVAFFATPVVLRAVGVHAQAFENRRLAKPPALSQGWDVFDQTTRFLTDRMPLREEAVRANTYIAKHIFDTTPQYTRRGTTGGNQALPFAGAPKGMGAAPRKKAKGALQGFTVLPGKDGWLYIGDEFSAACLPQTHVELALAHWRRVIEIVRRSGRRVVLMIPPDKGGIYPEHLKLDPAKAACTRQGKRRFWDLLSREGPQAGMFPLREDVLALKRRTRGPIYSRTDSHWNQPGATVLTKATLQRIRRGVRVAPGEIVRARPARLLGDLTRLLGETGRETMPSRIIRRARGARRVPGRTTYLFDSFGAVVNYQLDPYFAELRAVPWGAGAQKLTEAIVRADTVILEVVERAFVSRTTPQGEANVKFLRALEKRLSGPGGRRR